MVTMVAMQKCFEDELCNYLKTIEKMGARSAEIQADWLYARVEGHVYDRHKMSLCYVAMIKEMMSKDSIVNKPSDNGEGAPLIIRYQMPRRSESDAHKSG